MDIQIGMDNRSVHVTVQTRMGRDYRVHRKYFLDGTEIMLRATKDVCSYGSAYDYADYSRPIIPAGSIVTPDVLLEGYDSHHFEIYKKTAPTLARGNG